MKNKNSIQCRICKSLNSTYDIGVIKPFVDYSCKIYECDKCKSRFSHYDKNTYEKLHSNSDINLYKFHNYLLKSIKPLFEKKDVKSLKLFLSKTPKFKFIIDIVENLDNANNILEVGCSKGYLTSYFILKGYNITGTDLSNSAIQQANNTFGKYFINANFLKKKNNKQFDVIYHVGTIGCVDNPIEFTNDLLTLLRPGGYLLFNVPNVDACKELNQKWISETTPPDLTTLFDKDFFKYYFQKKCKITIQVQKTNLFNSLIKLFNKIKNKDNFQKPTIKFSKNKQSNNYTPKYNILKKIFKYLIYNLINLIGKIVKKPSFSESFGIYVIMQKK